ncbi:SDR family oxidoreductase [Halorhabdus salina]|uniref:SDR family oxidoreductase n=1 Tax=Halorhabdus salina TaxID=2750670 RepID=UPI0015EE3ED2|nr:SDR family NAD(P)-dependent oxidoreductase [Halorhabdus salina]
MTIEYDFHEQVVLVTGAGGALGSATVEAFLDAGATVAAADVIAPDDDAHMLDTDSTRLSTHVVDFTDEGAVESVIETVLETHGRLDALIAVAGTWRGGDPVEATDIGTFELLFDVNVRTAFLATKHALPHLQESEGSIVTVASRSSLEGGDGDALYRASKAAVRLLTESIAAENEGVVRANAIMPSVIDTPANREAIPDADHESWVDPDEIADVIQFLASDAAAPTSGAAVPVYGES